uniref:Uncharacterized protein n=1 Tax=Romanomermis culicivorax TaxID=13658 RepID=A0A915IFM1_ROMCU
MKWTYNPKTFDCCRNYELCEKENRACCGKHCYSKSASLCCQGRIIDKCSLFHARNVKFVDITACAKCKLPFNKWEELPILVDQKL